MPAYILVEIQINDPEKYEGYKKLTPASIASYGGKFIVRGGHTESLEGNWEPGRIVIVEFPSIEKAKAWYTSPEYQAAKEIRLAASTGKMILVEGV